MNLKQQFVELQNYKLQNTSPTLWAQSLQRQHDPACHLEYYKLLSA